MEKMTASPDLYGIFGYNIDYSLSPLIHNSIAKILNVNLCYGKFDITPDKFPTAIEGFKALGLKGANITKPYKSEVLKYADSLSAESETVGAVNTLKLEQDGGYRGYNTDIPGFIEAVNYEFNKSLKDSRVMLIGAGGASRAVLYALIKENAGEVSIINRTFKNADILKKDANKWKDLLKSPTEIFAFDFNQAAALKKFVSKNFDFIFNAVTPGAESCKLMKDTFSNLLGKNYFMDVSYSSAHYNYPKYANGLSMLLFQALESFYIWTGKKLESGTIKNALMAYFKNYKIYDKINKK